MMVEQFEKLLVVKEKKQQELAQQNDVSQIGEQEDKVEQEIAFLRVLIDLWKEAGKL